MADRNKLTLDVIDLTGTGTCNDGLDEILSQLSSAEIPTSSAEIPGTPSADSSARGSEESASTTPSKTPTTRPVIVVNLVSPVRGSPAERKSSVMSRLSKKLSIKKASLHVKGEQAKKARIKKEKHTRTGALHVGCACGERM